MNKMRDADGFSHVSYKGKKKKNSTLPICSASDNTLKNFHTVIQNIRDELKFCDFTAKLNEDLLNVLQEWNFNLNSSELSDNDTCKNNKHSPINDKKQEIDIVCYGLGQFSSCIIARYQLGFLLFLKHILESFNVYVYDPQFSAEERVLLSELHLTVLNINEEAKRTVKRKTIFFMPHCDLPLYNNLLWSNWSMDNLSSLAIIGNSFQSYEINDSKSQLQSKAKYVYLANRFVTEIKMTNSFRFTDIFNDLSIHYFQSRSLSDIEPYVWSDVNEPEYSDDDTIKSN